MEPTDIEIEEPVREIEEPIIEFEEDIKDSDGINYTKLISLPSLSI